MPYSTASAQEPTQFYHRSQISPDAKKSSKYAELIQSARIAIVDDEEINIEVVQGHLEAEGYQQFYRTTDSSSAMAMIQQTKPDLVLLDVMMPVVSGLDILASMRASKSLSSIPVIILTATTNEDTKLRALALEASDFLAKPVDASELALRVRNVLSVKAYHDYLAHHSRELEKRVRERTQQLMDSRMRIIHCLARAAEFRDNETGRHVIRVGQYSSAIARKMGFDRQFVEIIEHAAQLHDIGKIGIPDAILLKDGKLEPHEFETIKNHCSIGNSIIGPMSQIEFQQYRKHSQIGASLLDIEGYPIMEMASVIAQTHHEKWDGSGYPLGLAGEEIPIEGRITAVADVFDALSSKRPYKPAFTREKCFEILEEGRGKHFDPGVLDAFLSLGSEIIDIQIRQADTVI